MLHSLRAADELDEVFSEGGNCFPHVLGVTGRRERPKGCCAPIKNPEAFELFEQISIRSAGMSLRRFPSVPSHVFPLKRKFVTRAGSWITARRTLMWATWSWSIVRRIRSCSS